MSRAIRLRSATTAISFCWSWTRAWSRSRSMPSATWRPISSSNSSSAAISRSGSAKPTISAAIIRSCQRTGTAANAWDSLRDQKASSSNDGRSARWTTRGRPASRMATIKGSAPIGFARNDSRPKAGGSEASNAASMISPASSGRMTAAAVARMAKATCLTARCSNSGVVTASLPAWEVASRASARRREARSVSYNRAWSIATAAWLAIASTRRWCSVPNGSFAERTRTRAPSRLSWARRGAARTVFARRCGPVTL